MEGKLYGVGVGPGDPMLMTLKAVKTIEKCPVYAVPGLVKEQSVAYRIASEIVDLSDKECIEIEMPMTKNPQRLKEAHQKGAGQIKEVLDQGKDIAMLTLGDPTVYATYIYLHKAIAAMGYQTEIINGIPSFCAAAAKLNIPLTEKSQELHIIPASYGREEALAFRGTKIFMKAGSKMTELKRSLVKAEKEKAAEIYMVENCGMENEKLYQGAEHINEQASYYSVVICKDKSEETDE